MCRRTTTIDSRERTFLALDHQMGDRIPIDCWATAAVFERLERYLGVRRSEFLDRYDVDLRYIAGPAYVGPTLEEGTDIWGVRRGVVASGGSGREEVYREVVTPPLALAESVEEIERYGHWPDPDWFDYSVIEAQCEAILRERRVVVFMGDRLNRVAQLKPAMYLRGTEEILLDTAFRQEIATAIFERIRTFYLGYLERILDAAKGKIDIVLTGDDFGAQNGMLLSPEVWRSLLRPGFSDFVGLIKSYDRVAMHHTCGSVVDIMPDMIDCGLDVLQSVQPEAKGMALGGLTERFGGRLCFHGGVSIQRTVPFGSPDDIRREVALIVEAVGSRGGYIFCTSHNIQADTPTENIVALMEAYTEYG